MLHRLRAAFVVATVALLTVAFPQPSRACGVWSLLDAEYGWLVVFRAGAIEAVHKPQQKQERRVVGATATARLSKEDNWRLMRFDPPRRVWRFGRSDAFRFSGGLNGGIISLNQRKIGRWSRTGVQIGRRLFRVAFDANYKPVVSRYSMIPDNEGRSVTVSRDGTVVLRGAAPTDRHCVGAGRMIAAYLAWREVFAARLATR